MKSGQFGESRYNPGTENKPYQWLAEYYDTLFGPFRFPIDAARRHRLGRILERAESVCDLGCATGDTVLALAERGVRAYGVDLSPGMCRVARRKAAERGLAVTIIQSDMREFALPEPVDVLICEYDAINHVPRKADLLKVARCAAGALKPGGTFYFDVNNALGFERYWNATIRIGNDDVIVYMRNGHDPKARKAWSDVEWFVRRGKSWVRHEEHIEEICWTEDEIRATLARAGFEGVQSWDAARYFKNSPVVPGCRTLYLARRGSARRGTAPLPSRL